MHYKITAGERIFSVVNAIILTVLLILFLYPVLYILFGSFSDPGKMMEHRGILFAPIGFTLDAYKLVLKNPLILTSYANTLYYVIAGTAINVFLTTLGAYGLSRKKLLLKNFFMLMITFTMFFSGGLVPSYLLVKSLHLQDTRWVMLIPTAISAYNLIIMRTFFYGIPDSLEESAKIDGAGDFTVLFKILVPVAKPVIAVMVLFYGVGHWNEWFNASIYMTDRDLFPLQLIIREILIQNSTDSMMTDVGGADKALIGESVKYATIVVATIPILFIYPFLQKYFQKGFMLGSIKG